MASIKVVYVPRQTRPDITDPQAVSDIWKNAELAAQREVRRNLLRRAKTPDRQAKLRVG